MSMKIKKYASGQTWLPPKNGEIDMGFNLALLMCPT